MNLKPQFLRSLVAVAAMTATVAAVAQQQPPARQRNTSSSLPAPADSTGANSTTASPRYNSTDATARANTDMNTTSNSKLSHRDRSFIEKAAKSGMKEVEVSQTVLPKLGASGGAHDFAQMMIDDHTKANEELKALAARKGVTLPMDNNKWAKKWADNDKDVAVEYLMEMKDDHKEDVELFEKASKSEDPDIAAFAQKTLPTIQHHLSMLQNDNLKTQPLSSR